MESAQKPRDAVKTATMVVIPSDAPDSDLPSLLEAPAALLAGGEVVGFPTETVYGLGANALNPSAVAKVFAAKGRPMDNPLIVHIASPDDLQPLISTPVEDLPASVKTLMSNFWPGALTLLFPASELVPKATTGGLNTVAVRCPSAPIVRALISTAGVPLAAPSANKSGRPSPTTAAHVFKDLSQDIPMIVDGGPTIIGLESTVVNALSDPPIVLRPGGITLEALQAVIPSMTLYTPGTNSGLEAAPPTPGLKYTHYSPGVPVTLIKPRNDSAAMTESTLEVLKSLVRSSNSSSSSSSSSRPLGLVITDPSGMTVDWSLELNTPVEIVDLSSNGPEGVARGLFASLRSLDEDAGVTAIVVQGISETGAGLAVMNRLRKAASEEK